MELKTLVELLYTAHQRFTTLQISWRYQYDLRRMQIAERRWADMNPPGSVTMLTSLAAEARAPIRVQRRVWWQKPDCWREEQQAGDKNRTTTILCHGEWWSFSSSSNILYTNTVPDEARSHSAMQVEKGQPPDLQQLIMAVPLLDPSFLLTSHALEPIGERIHAGREAVQVRAIYQKRKDYLHEAFFWATADEYQLLVDREYGILLRYAAVLDSAEYAVASVEHVVFDAPIPAETFVFTP